MIPYMSSTVSFYRHGWARSIISPQKNSFHNKKKKNLSAAGPSGSDPRHIPLLHRRLHGGRGDAGAGHGQHLRAADDRGQAGTDWPAASGQPLVGSKKWPDHNT